MRARAARQLATAALAAGLGVASPACFEPIDGGACRGDRDCPDAVCSNVGECAAATYRLRVAWTLGGTAANESPACERVGELEIVVSDSSTGEASNVRPVPCAIGSFLFDKLPWGYGAATVNAYGPRGELLDSAGGSTDPAVGTINVDLQL
jgi:hypothetical protein